MQRKPGAFGGGGAKKLYGVLPPLYS